MENRIKEQQFGLFADRTSAATNKANQPRLYFASFAYVLMHALRRLGTKGTRFAPASPADHSAGAILPLTSGSPDWASSDEHPRVP